jgi:hypothetical protein
VRFGPQNGCVNRDAIPQVRAWIAARLGGGSAPADAVLAAPLADVGGRVRSLVYLYASGCVVGLLTLVLPHSTRFRAQPVLELVGTTVIVMCFLLVRFDAIGAIGINIVVAYATIAITAANLLSHTAAAEYNALYWWIVLYAALYLAAPATLFQVGLAVAGVSLSLWRADAGADRLGRWFSTAAALVMTGLVVRMLRHRVDTLIARLARAAQTDALTGLWNRRHFDHVLRIEIARA